MKNIIYRYGHIMTAVAVTMTTYSSNRNCNFFFHQSELPEEAKTLRKF